MRYTGQEIQDMIKEILESICSHEVGIDRVDTFEDRGLLTNDKGVVIRTEDGSEFQITIVQSR